MAKIIFFTEKAPSPIGAYSQAVISGGVMYLSGQISLDPETGEFVKGGIEEETDQILKNIKTIVKESGRGMRDVIKTTCYLSDMDDFDGFNKVYQDYFSTAPPARTTIQAARLPAGVKIEIDAIVDMSDR
ncbi:MAG: Rid family detoxifying hydrolase [Halobacteriota archaeon]|nr:Rid family detoxifying hydrolase [Halobacteriota archaeon]